VKFISRIGQESTYLDYKSELNSEDLVRWLQGEEYSDICEHIYQGYIDYLVHQKSHESPFTFGKMYHSGAISVKELWRDVDFEKLRLTFFALTKKLIENEYIVQLSEIKSTPDNTTSFIIYLKPSYRLPKIDDKSNQLLGNIHMELKKQDDKLVFFKIIVHRYNDRKWHAGHDFDTFMAFMFNNAVVDLF
jgi:hypothetical protein